MFRNLTANLVLHERIETTDAKAKELRRVAERLITKARRLGESSYTPFEKLTEKEKARRLAVKRQIASYLPRWGTRTEKGGETTKVDLVEKVLIDLAKRFATREGGYTRIVKFGPRRGDNAPISIIELMPATAPAEGASTDDERPAKASKAKKAKAKPEADAAATEAPAKTDAT